jgi:hypothetical protein
MYQVVGRVCSLCAVSPGECVESDDEGLKADLGRWDGAEDGCIFFTLQRKVFNVYRSIDTSTETHCVRILSSLENVLSQPATSQGNLVPACFKVWRFRWPTFLKTAGQKGQGIRLSSVEFSCTRGGDSVS